MGLLRLFIRLFSRHSSPKPTTQKRAGSRTTKPLVLNTIAAAAVSEDSLPFSEPKSPRGAARRSAADPFNVHKLGNKIEGQTGHGENSSNPGKSSRENSRNNSEANSPGKSGDPTMNLVPRMIREDALSSGRAKGSKHPSSIATSDALHSNRGDAASNSAKSSRPNSRNNTPFNSPGKNGDREQAVNASPTTSKEQVDDRDLLIRKGYAVTTYPLLDSYDGEMKDKKHTHVALTTLRSIGKRTHNDTFNQWRMEVKRRLGKEIEDWKKVDGSFVQYEGFTTFSGVPTLITEFIEGTPAKEYLEKKSKEKRRLILEFARALKTLHGQNLSHGTIEPCHFMVDKKGKAKVGGYCYNRMVEEEFEKLYPSEDHRGSARYVAPEFLESRKTDEHTDVYSFGLVAMELLTGVQPFDSVSQEASLIGRVKRGETPFAEDIAKDDAWRTVLSSCWMKEPEARPSMERLYEELSKAFKK